MIVQLGSGAPSFVRLLGAMNQLEIESRAPLQAADGRAINLHIKLIRARVSGGHDGYYMQIFRLQIHK